MCASKFRVSSRVTGSLHPDPCDCLHLRINWAATSLSSTPPAAPDQTLASFFTAGPNQPARPAKRKVPADLHLAMLRSLPADVRADVLSELGLTDADIVAAEEEEEQETKRMKTGDKGTSPSIKAELIDLTGDLSEPSANDEDEELWEQWPAEELAETSTEAVAEGIVRCPVPGCDERLFPFALRAHLAYHDS